MQRRGWCHMSPAPAPGGPLPSRGSERGCSGAAGTRPATPPLSLRFAGTQGRCGLTGLWTLPRAHLLRSETLTRTPPSHSPEHSRGPCPAGPSPPHCVAVVPGRVLGPAPRSLCERAPRGHPGTCNEVWDTPVCAPGQPGGGGQHGHTEADASTATGWSAAWTEGTEGRPAMPGGAHLYLVFAKKPRP